MNDPVFNLAALIAPPLWVGLILGIVTLRLKVAAGSLAGLFVAMIGINVLDARINPELMEMPLGQALLLGSICLLFSPVAIALLIGLIRWTHAGARAVVQDLQAGLDPYDTKAWDAAVIQAAEIMEQRQSGRNRGAEIIVILRAGADWGVWRSAAAIWEREQIGQNRGVSIRFSNPSDMPRYEAGCLVRSGR